jgi:hypothetical protein
MGSTSFWLLSFGHVAVYTVYTHLGALVCFCFHLFAQNSATYYWSTHVTSEAIAGS